MAVEPILVNGQWRAAEATRSFRASEVVTGAAMELEFPVSSWADGDAALSAASAAMPLLRAAPAQQRARFLTALADRLESDRDALVESAHRETGLARSPRLADVELPRTTGQLRQAAAAAIDGAWALPTIDTRPNIRSCFAAIGPVWVLGPANFPLAFNPIGGGDFAAAIAAGNPVIAKAHPNHPGTTRLLARAAVAALADSGLPAAAVQLIYHLEPRDGLRLAGDARLGAIAFTGSRGGGLAIKAAADAAGTPAYLEMSSLNPVIILPGALAAREGPIVKEYCDSCLAAAGQFCTKPGIVLLVGSSAADRFLAAVKQEFASRPPAPLLSTAVLQQLESNVGKLVAAGATLIIGGGAIPGAAPKFANTLLRVAADRFIAQPEPLQTEAFGNAALAIVAENEAQALAVLARLDGSLTGSIYSDSAGADDPLYARVEPVLRDRVGRLLNDKMPTGVAVTAAMNHGGPFPATGHAGFTSVGIPASLRRFAMLQCYDNVRPDRLPPLLTDRNPTGRSWRCIDGAWSQGDVPPAAPPPKSA